MASVQEIIDYYVNLLIIQYHNKPKAQETIRLFADTMLASGVMLDVENGYNLDTAVGKQLDIIGKYEGVDRFYKDFDLTDYFGVQTYTEPAPTFPPRHGLTDYASYDTDPPKGTLKYSDIISFNAQLLDDAFRTLIKLKIIQNYSNHADGDIDDRLFALFGTGISMEDPQNMRIVYFITLAESALIDAIIYKKVLPRPMAVTGLIVSGTIGLVFGLTDYYGAAPSTFGYGFSTYADYDSLSGTVLTYNNIQVA